MQQLDHRVLTARLTTHRTVRLEANCRTTGDRQSLEYSAGRCPGSESLRVRTGFLPPDMTRTRARKSRMFVEIARVFRPSAFDNLRSTIEAQQPRDSKNGQ